MNPLEPYVLRLWKEKIMNTEIIEGCTAMIINSMAGNNGKIVKVGIFVGKVAGWEGDKRWSIDTVLRGKKGNKTRSAETHRLMRMDGLSEAEKIEERQLIRAV